MLVAHTWQAEERASGEAWGLGMNRRARVALVTIERCTDPIQAHTLLGRLEAEGIRAFVAHEHHVWANWFMSDALQGVWSWQLRK